MLEGRGPIVFTVIAGPPSSQTPGFPRQQGRRRCSWQGAGCRSTRKPLARSCQPSGTKDLLGSRGGRFCCWLLRQGPYYLLSRPALESSPGRTAKEPDRFSRKIELNAKCFDMAWGIQDQTGVRFKPQSWVPYVLSLEGDPQASHLSLVTVQR